MTPQKPLNPAQWKAMIRYLTGGNREKPKKAKPKDPPKEDDGH